MRRPPFPRRAFPACSLPHPAHRSARASCASTASAPTARTAWRKARAFAFRRSGSIRRRRVGQLSEAANKTLQVHQGHDPLRGCAGHRAQQAGRPCRAGRLGRDAPRRRHAGVVHRPARSQAETRPQARPRHGRRAGGRAHAHGRRFPRPGLQGARDAQALLGAGGRRAASATGTRFDFPCERRGPAGRPHAHRQARRARRRSCGHSVCGRRPGGPKTLLAHHAADHRADASAARPRWPISGTRSSATRNISTWRTGSCRAASRTGCISSRAASSSPIRMAACSTPAAPLLRHMLQSWNLLGLEHDRFDPIENAPEE